MKEVHPVQAAAIVHTNGRAFIHFITRMVRESQKDYLRLFLK